MIVLDIPTEVQSDTDEKQERKLALCWSKFPALTIIRRTQFEYDAKQMDNL